MAAQFLSTGRASGSISGASTTNPPVARTMRRHAGLEGVGTRVQLHPGDIIKMPLRRPRLNVVLSSLTIHNIKRCRRTPQKAINEAVRGRAPKAGLWWPTSLDDAVRQSSAGARDRWHVNAPL